MKPPASAAAAKGLMSGVGTTPPSAASMLKCCIVLSAQHTHQYRHGLVEDVVIISHETHKLHRSRWRRDPYEEVAQDICSIGLTTQHSQELQRTQYTRC